MKKNIAIILLSVFCCNFLHSDQTQYTKQLKELASAGNADACFELGNCYFYGRGIGRDLYSAFNWYYEGAHGNNGAAQFNLALCYDQGYGTDLNKILAIKWYQKAADNGIVPAKFNMAMYYKKGERIKVGEEEVIFKQDSSRAYTLLRECSRAGFIPADRELAKYYLSEATKTDDNFKIGMSYLLTATREKDTEALFILAKYYIEKGESYDRILPLMKIAAKGDIPEALEFVGVACECGKNMKQDRKLAFDYYRRAAEKGLLSAQIKLADYYANGTIVQQNIWEARKW